MLNGKNSPLQPGGVAPRLVNIQLPKLNPAGPLLTLNAQQLQPTVNKFNQYFDRLLLVKQNLAADDVVLANLRAGFQAELLKLLATQLPEIAQAKAPLLTKVQSYEKRLGLHQRLSDAELIDYYNAKKGILDLDSITQQNFANIQTLLFRLTVQQKQRANQLTPQNAAAWFGAEMNNPVPVWLQLSPTDQKNLQTVLDKVARKKSLDNVKVSGGSPDTLKAAENLYFEKAFQVQMIQLKLMEQFNSLKTSVRYNDLVVGSPDYKKLLADEKILLASMITYPSPGTNANSYQNTSPDFARMNDLFNHPAFTNPYDNDDPASFPQRALLGRAFEASETGMIQGYVTSPGTKEILAKGLIPLINQQNMDNMNFSGKGFLEDKFDPNSVVNTVMEGITAKGSNFTGASFPMNYKLDKTIFSGMSTGNSVTGGDPMTMYGDAKTASKFTGARLEFVDMSGVKAAGVDFSSAQAQGLNLRGADVDGADFTNTVLKWPAHLDNASAKLATFDGTDLTSVIAPGANFSGASFIGSDATQADFTGANFTGTVFLNKAKFTSADFTGANLTESIAKNASMIGGRFTQANMRNFIAMNSSFASAKFTQVDLNSAALTNSSFDGATFVATVGEGVNFTGSTWKNATFQGSYFANSNLSGVDVSGVSFTNGNLSGVNFGGTTEGNSSAAMFDPVKGMFSSLAGTNLSASSFYKLNLGTVDLSGADLQNVDLRGADLSKVKFNAGTNFKGALIDDATKLPLATGQTRDDFIVKQGLVHEKQATLQILAAELQAQVLNSISAFEKIDAYQQSKDLFATVDGTQSKGKQGGDVTWYYGLFGILDYATGYDRAAFTDSNFSNAAVKAKMDAVLAQVKDLVALANQPFVSGTEGQFSDQYKAIMGYTPAQRDAELKAVADKMPGYLKTGIFKGESMAATLAANPNYIKQYQTGPNPTPILTLPAGTNVQQYIEKNGLIDRSASTNKPLWDKMRGAAGFYVKEIKNGQESYTYYRFVPPTDVPGVYKAATEQLSQNIAGLLGGSLGEATQTMRDSITSKDKYRKYSEGINQMFVWLGTALFKFKGLIAAPIIIADMGKQNDLFYGNADGSPIPQSRVDFNHYLAIKTGYAALPAMTLGAPVKTALGSILGNSIMAKAASALAGHFVSGAFLTFNHSYVEKAETAISPSDYNRALLESIKAMPEGGLKMMVFGGLLDTALATPGLALSGVKGLLTLRRIRQNKALLDKHPDIKQYLLEQNGEAIGGAIEAKQKSLDAIDSQIEIAKAKKDTARVKDLQAIRAQLEADLLALNKQLAANKTAIDLAKKEVDKLKPTTPAPPIDVSLPTNGLKTLVSLLNSVETGGTKLTTVTEMQAFLDAIWPQVAPAGTPKPVLILRPELSETGSGAGYSPGQHVIYYAPEGMSKRTLVHEIGHAVEGLFIHAEVARGMTKAQVEATGALPQNIIDAVFANPKFYQDPAVLAMGKAFYARMVANAETFKTLETTFKAFDALDKDPLKRNTPAWQLAKDAYGKAIRDYMATGQELSAREFEARWMMRQDQTPKVRQMGTDYKALIYKIREAQQKGTTDTPAFRTLMDDFIKFQDDLKFREIIENMAKMPVEPIPEPLDPGGIFSEGDDW